MAMNLLLQRVKTGKGISSENEVPFCLYLCAGLNRLFTDFFVMENQYRQMCFLDD